MDLKLINHKLIIILFIAVAGSMVIFAVYFRLGNTAKLNLPIPRQNPTIQPTKIILPGQIILQYDRQNSTKNKIVLVAYGNSKDQSITTFDIDVRYNHDKLTKESVEGMIAGFDIIPTNISLEDSNQSELIITGIKAQYNQETVIFNNQQLVKIVFNVTQPLVSDDIELFFESGQTYDSNLINID